MSGSRLGWPFAVWSGVGLLAEPALRLLLRRRLRLGKELPGRLAERRGIDPSPRPEGRLIWLHAASVGETISLLPLLDALCQADSTLQLLLTAGTVSAERLASQRLASHRLGQGGAQRIRCRFAPLDLPRWVNRFLDHWRPDLAVLVESELWPNLIRGCVRRRIPLALLNARMSARSARRWARTGPVVRRLLGAFDWITARSEQDAERFRLLGAMSVGHDGDLKQAAAVLPADPDELARLRALLGGRPAWLAASTHDGEEETVARLHGVLSARHPGLLTLVAPRHPDRGEAVAALLGAAPRRSAGQDPDQADGCWVCDTMGELGLFYRLADVVLLGNSFDGVHGPGGGHNPWEPARLGCAVASGPQAQNFEADMARLQAAGALAILPDLGACETWLDAMLRHPDRRRAMADAAHAMADASAGLPERLARRLLALIGTRS